MTVSRSNDKHIYLCYAKVSVLSVFSYVYFHTQPETQSRQTRYSDLLKCVCCLILYINLLYHQSNHLLTMYRLFNTLYESVSDHGNQTIFNSISLEFGLYNRQIDGQSFIQYMNLTTNNLYNTQTSLVFRGYCHHKA